jgi:hypothetical protein
MQNGEYEPDGIEPRINTDEHGWQFPVSMVVVSALGADFEPEARLYN